MDIIRAQHTMLHDPAHARLPHAPAYTEGAAFAGGKYGPIAEATVPLLDLGFRHADAAYDVVSASRGYLFRLDDHLTRMEESCARFRLKSPHSREQTTHILMQLLRLAGTRDAYVWWCVTRGQRREGGEHNNQLDYQNAFYAYVVPYRFIADDDIRTRGIELMVSQQFIRIPTRAVDARAKNFHWMDLQLSLFEAHDQRYDFSVLCDANGFLTEAPGSNVFVVKNGEVLTPDTGCLEGITRRTACELVKELGAPMRVEPVHVDSLRGADAAFLTSSAGGIMPIRSVDGQVLSGAGQSKDLVTEVHNLYWSKRWAGWHGTPVQYTGHGDGPQ